MSRIHSLITTTFLKSLVQKYNDDVANLEFSIDPLSAVDNFTSKIYRIQINYKNSKNVNNETSFILKVCMEDGFLSDYAKIMKYFDTEIDMYNRIVPKINCLEYIQKFSPTVVYTSLAPHPCLIMEDLTIDGYKMQCRHKGLDLDHCLIVMDKLAYFHSSSIAIQEKETLTNFNKGLFWNNVHITNWMNIGLKSVIETCSNFNHLNQYATKLKLIQHKFVDNVFGSTKNSKICNVLNHGDCSINNVMFSYNPDGSINDVVLLDLQVCLYSSPVIDLHCFWATSPNIEVLAKHFDEVLDYYYKRFIDNVKKLKIKAYVPSKLELMTDFKEKVIYGLNTLLTMTPFIKVDKRPDATIENFYKYFDKDSFRYDCYNNERYLERITLLLAFYDSFGVFQ